jgi:hypothetical protein
MLHVVEQLRWRWHAVTKVGVQMDIRGSRACAVLVAARRGKGKSLVLCPGGAWRAFVLVFSVSHDISL